MIEVLVATGIALVILLLAASAVRIASQSLRLIRTTAEENALLQRGWLEALQDVDYWQSHASPDFPYLAGPMSETVSISGGTDHPWDKRPFRPVTFRPDLNPNLLLPHDPRSWYRGALSVGPMPVSRPAGSYEPTFICLSTPDAIGSVFKSDSPLTHFPAGWAPWHQMGDYAAITRALATGDGDTEYQTAVGADPSRAVSDYLPSLQWWLFSVLGHTGVSAYLPAGSLSLINRPATNRTVANIGNPAKYFDWGEVPWTFAAGGPGGANDFSPQAFTTPSTADFPAGAISQVRRHNMLLGYPGSGNGLTGIRSSVLNFPSWWRSQSRYTNERSGFNTAFAMDLETVSSPAKCEPGNWNSGGYYPHALFYPGKAFRVGVDWDATTLIDRTVEDPFRLMWDADANDDYNVASTTKQSSRMWKRFTRVTQHQPAVATDDDRRPDSFDSNLQMRHELVRFRTSYNDRARVTVTVHNPTSGNTMSVIANTIGTSFKGARQHWGWKSSVRADLPPMGDRYAP